MWIAIVLSACSSTSEDLHSDIAAVLAGSEILMDENSQIGITDTLYSKKEIHRLESSIQEWKSIHQNQFEAQLQMARGHFGADHVKHLYQKQLALIDMMDSVLLVQDYLTSFTNQDDFDAEYLKDYYFLQHTLDLIKEHHPKIIWYGIDVQQATETQKFIYLPDWQEVFPRDTLSSDLQVLNQFYFQKSNHLD